MRRLKIGGSRINAEHIVAANGNIQYVDIVFANNGLLTLTDEEAEAFLWWWDTYPITRSTLCIDVVEAYRAVKKPDVTPGDSDDDDITLEVDWCDGMGDQ